MTADNPTLTDDRYQVESTLHKEALLALEDSMPVEAQENHAFVALNEDLEQVEISQATQAYSLFGNENRHAWKVYVGNADGTVDPELLCSMKSPSLISCRTFVTESGELVFESTLALVRMPEVGPDAFTFAATALEEGKASEYRLERNVKVFHASGSVTSVTESVRAPSTLEVDKVFSSSLDDLRALATSDNLIWR